jgi:hypothetical protein
MTEKLNNKLRKFLSKPRLTPIGDRKLQPAILTDSKAQALVSFKKYMPPPPLPYFKVNISPLPLPHFASIFFAYL